MWWMLACGDPEDSDTPDTPDTPARGSISGWVCRPDAPDPDASVLVYTSLYDEEGRIVDVARSYTDADHAWRLDDLPTERSYAIYAQHERDVLWTVDVYVHDGEDVVIGRACDDQG